MVAKSEGDKRTPGREDANEVPNGYCPKQVEDGVKVLFKVLEKTSTSKKSLFEDEGEYIQLAISSIRIPKNKKKHYRFVLPHSFLKDTADVCLFVKNLSKNDREYEDTVRYFKNFITVAGVTGVTEVISVNQLMQEYKTYEMRRRLAARFDMFLADNSISDWLHHALGKGFHRCRKQPNPVDLNSKNLKDEIAKALMKTTLTISGHGAQFLVKIGNTKQTVQQICQNIEAVAKGLRYTLPGQWKNVRSLHIRTDDSIAVPIYYSLAHPNSVKVPKQEQPPGRKSIPVEVDEISTLPDGYEVMVLPSGIVKVRGKKQDGTIGWLSDKELEELGDLEPLNDKDEEVEDEVDGQFASDTEEYDRPDLDSQGKDFSSGSEDDESVVKAAEEAYLKELSEEMVSKPGKQKVEETKSTSEKLPAPDANKRKLEKSNSLASVKKPKGSNFSDWKVEVISTPNKSVAKNGKGSKNLNKSWKVDEVVQMAEAKATKLAGAVAKCTASNFSSKSKVSGNSLGMKRKLKAKMRK
ncbi:putative ribosome biogenesis protein C8F11.04 [Ischnura elegans]|uniref:putative ribosome biogenesis protein C8F11.04 n=1 Tax=Ischnura elegans TaxID=197161 RepID=UPI001ED8B4A4|nr:putative ribosome biogenesis protein C8F11.04 [Ischnura elegans]